jgi:hypothetical protein
MFGLFKISGRCQNEAETGLWELTRLLLTIVETRLVHHTNTGVRITAIKCLQVIVLLLSKVSQVKKIWLRVSPFFVDVCSVLVKGRSSIIKYPRIRKRS